MLKVLEVEAEHLPLVVIIPVIPQVLAATELHLAFQGVQLPMLEEVELVDILQVVLLAELEVVALGAIQYRVQELLEQQILAAAEAVAAVVMEQ